VQRDDERICRGAGSRNKREELRCRNRTHVRIFCLGAALNKAKGETAMVVNAAADTNRMPLLLGFRIFECAVRAFQSKAADRRV
jgi:hypothetical protein